MKSGQGNAAFLRKVFLVLPVLIILGGIVIGLAVTLETPRAQGFEALSPGTVQTSTTILSVVQGAFNTVPGSSASSFGPGNPNFVPPATIVLSPNPTHVSSQGSTGAKVAAPSPLSQSGSIEFFSNLTMRVLSPQAGLTKAAGIAYSVGGYVAFSSSTNNSATAVLRIPTSEYQDALTQVEAIGNVTNFVSTSNDVTIKYTDLNATLQSLLTERQAFLRLLNQSTALNATIQIEGYLQGVNAQINSVQSQILQTRRLIDFATITVGFVRTTVRTQLGLKVIAAPLTGASPLSVTFRSFLSGGTPGYIVNYNFGDGMAAQGEALIHTYTKAGNYNATISVTDSTGNVKSQWLMVHVLGAPIGFDFTGFTVLAANLFFGVIQGIVEVAIVVIPLALVAAAVLIPVRNRLRSGSKANADKGS